MLVLGRFYNTWIAFDPMLFSSRFRVGVTWRANGKFQSVDFVSNKRQTLESIHKTMTEICERERIELE